MQVTHEVIACIVRDRLEENPPPYGIGFVDRIPKLPRYLRASLTLIRY